MKSFYHIQVSQQFIHLDQMTRVPNCKWNATMTFTVTSLYLSFYSLKRNMACCLFVCPQKTTTATICPSRCQTSSSLSSALTVSRKQSRSNISANRMYRKQCMYLCYVCTFFFNPFKQVHSGVTVALHQRQYKTWMSYL